MASPASNASSKATIERLRTKTELQKQIIRDQEDEIQRLRAAMRALIDGDGKNAQQIQEELDDELVFVDEEGDIPIDIPEESSSEAEDGPEFEDEDDYPPPTVDEEGTPRCVECGWEVVDGFCSECGLEHQMIPDAPYHLVDKGSQGIFAQSWADHPDRALEKRATTPLLPIYGTNLPPLYRSRNREYRQLLRRGATEAMCIMFELSYSDDVGIVAWAPPVLIDDFGWPEVQQEKQDLQSELLQRKLWRICLGRRVELEFDDPEGYEFVAGLVEDVLYYPPNESGCCQWETIKDDKSWVTRPVYVPTEDEFNGSDYGGYYYPDTEGEDAQALQPTAGEDEAPGISTEPDVIRATIVNDYEYDDDDDISSDDEDETEDVVALDAGWAIRADMDAGNLDPEWLPENGTEEDEEEEESATDASDEEGSGAEGDFDSDALGSDDEEVIAEGVKNII